MKLLELVRVILVNLDINKFSLYKKILSSLCYNNLSFKKFFVHLSALFYLQVIFDNYLDRE